MKKHFLIAVTISVIIGCSDKQPAKIDISKEFEINKQNAIADALPYLESTMHRLASICAELKHDSACSEALYEIQTQVHQYKRGEWQELSKISLDEYAALIASSKMSE